MVLPWVLPLVLSWLIFSWVIMKLLYRRCVDDIIYLFNCESDADKFFFQLFLNTQHCNIKFTVENKVNKQISFLDVLITNDGNQFCTLVFRKETELGIFIEMTV